MIDLDTKQPIPSIAPDAKSGGKSSTFSDRDGESMSDSFRGIKDEIETILAKFKSSTDLAEKQRLLKEAEHALERAGGIALPSPGESAKRKSRVRAKRETGP